MFHLAEILHKALSSMLSNKSLQHLLQRSRQFFHSWPCDLASVFAIYALAFIYVYRLVLTPGIITGFDWPIPPERHHVEFMFWRRLWSWWYDPAFTGFPSNPLGLSALSYDALVYLESLLGLNGEAISKIMLVSVLALSGISAYCLLKHLKLSLLTRISGAVFYMSLPVMADWLVVLGPASIATTYALFPVTFLFYLKALSPQGNWSRLKWCILASLTSTGVYPIFGLILSSFVFLAHTIWMILVSTRRTEVFKRHLITLSIIFLIAFVTQFWWIQSLLSSHWEQELAGMVQSVGNYPTNLLYSFGLMGHYHPVYESYLVELKIPLLAIFAYPVLAFSSILYRRDHETWFFTILALPFIVFMGTEWGFALVKSNFLMLGVFRDMSKAAVIPSLCYAILSARVLDKMIRKTKTHRRKMVLTVLLIILISAYIEPRLRGDLVSSPPQNAIWPSAWSFATDFIEQQPGDFKILWVPTGSYTIIRGSGSNTSLTADFYGIYSPKPGIVMGLSQRSELVPEYWLTNLLFPPEFSPAASQAMSSEPASSEIAWKWNGSNVQQGLSLSKILGLFNVQYLICRNISSFNWFTTYSSPVWERNSEDEMNYLENRIKADPNMIKIHEVGDVSIFNNTNNLPHFFGTSSLVIVGGDLSFIRLLSAMPDKSYFNDMALAFAAQQDNDKVVKFADFLILEDEQKMLELLIPSIEGCQKIEPGIYANQEMAKEWSDVHRWYWVYENYQESLERIAVTSSPQARLSIPFTITEDGPYLVFSKVFLSRLGSQLVFNLRDGSNTSLRKVNADTFDPDEASFQWMLISSSTTTRALNSSILDGASLSPWNLTRGSYTLDIDSLSGENAIASILIVPSAECEAAKLELQRVIKEKPILTLQSEFSNLTTIHEQRKALIPCISWQRVNPTKYVVSVEGSSGPFYMIFLERYDEKWEAYIPAESKSVELHFPVYGYANAWYINKTGDFDVTVTYLPQEMLDVGLRVSFLAYLACIFYITYSGLRVIWKKRMKGQNPASQKDKNHGRKCVKES